MFWRVASFNQTSPVEAVLDRPEFTLEDLLEEDDLIQECKALNSRLIDFLKLPASVAKLLEYITQPAGLDADDKRQFKYPFSSAEVLCCEVDAIFSTLLEDGALCGALFALLDQPRPLDCMLAGYFARVLVCLLMRRSRDLLRYLKDNQQHLPKLVAHMENTSVAEALAHLLGADDLSATFMAPGDLAWLADTGVLQDLLDTLGSTAGGPARENAAIVLSAVARSNTCPLTHALGSAEFLDQLLTRATASNGSAAEVAQALDVPIALLERRAALEAARQQYPSESGPTAADICVEEQTAAAVAAHASLLAGMLEPADGAAVQLTPFGCLAPPLGLARVKVAELFAALLGVGSAPAGGAVAAAGVLQRTLALVLQFPFNNILHAQATRMLLASLEYGDDALLTHLFTDCDLIGWLTSAPEEVAPLPSAPTAADQQGNSIPADKDAAPSYGGSRPGAGSDTGSSFCGAASPADSSIEPAASAASSMSNGSSADSNNKAAVPADKERAPLRAGYLGHLTLVANRMIGAAGRRRTVKRFLDDSDAWAAFVDGALKARNSNEDTSAWQCGRPDPRSIPTSSAPLDADEPGSAPFSEEEMEKLPGGYGGANSPLGSPTAASADRYGEAGGAAFGDVEEDEGASGNPGDADLQQGGKGDGQEHVDVLIDAVKALDALRLGEGPRGRSPTLAAAGGALSSPPPSSTAPAQPAQMSSDWEAETDAAGTTASNSVDATAASSSPAAAPPQGEASPAEQQVADVAVDLFRSPRSKGGFGKIDDWADFPEPSTSDAPPASPGPLPSLLAASAPPNSPVSAAPLASVRTSANKSSSFTRGPRCSSSPKTGADAAVMAPASSAGPASPTVSAASVAPLNTRRRSLDASSPGSTAMLALSFGHGSGGSSSSGSSPRSPGHGGSSPHAHSGAPPLPIAEPAVMPPEGSVGPPSPAARVGSPNAMLALPLASSLSPGSPSRLAAPSLLHWPAAGHSRLGSGEASPGGADAATAHNGDSPGGPGLHHVGGNGAAAAAPRPPSGSAAAAAVTLPHGQLSASLAAAAASDGAATGVVLPVKAVPVQPMAVGGVSDPPRPPPPDNSTASSTKHLPTTQRADPATAAAPAQAGATGNSSPPVAAQASFGDWADFGSAFARPNAIKAPQADAAPNQHFPASPPPRQQADSELQLEESQPQALSPFKRTGSLRAHNFWALEDTPASETETDSDRDD